MNKTQTCKLEGFVIKEAENFFQTQGFTALFPPKIVRASGACENINTLFEVAVDEDHKWFNRSAYLSQTGQLYLEAMVPSLKKVYCVGPSFRAEPKIDNRHLTEFTMLEIEFAGNFKMLLEYIEQLVHHLAQKVVAHPNAAKEFGISSNHIKQLAKCPAVFEFSIIRVYQKIARLAMLWRSGWGPLRDEFARLPSREGAGTAGREPCLILKYSLFS